MKYLLSLIIVAVSATYCFAQHTASDQILSRNWEIIGTTDFRQVRDDEAYAVYSPEIKKYANKIFELRGYLVPLDDGMKQSRFMLSTLPINQCFYCGRNGIPIMVLVEMVKPVKFTYRPIRIKGILKISNKNVYDVPPVTLTIANLVQN